MTAGAPPPAGAPLVALAGLTKRYGGALAVDAVDLAVAPGEIHALLGENGAGKSTLVRMLYGAVRPSAGTIRWQGRAVMLDSPVAARALGIGMVFQHFSLFDALSVAENVAVALSGAGARLPAVRARLAALSRGYGLALDPDRAVSTLSAGERQRIEIVRCLLQDPRLVILDEPTSVLTPGEAEQLFTVLERLAREGRALLYISHRLDEVRRLCARATILRAGRVVATIDPRAHAARAIAGMMVGGAVGEVRPHAPAPDGAADILTVAGLDLAPASVHGRRLAGIGLAVRAGEILGVAGVAGNGQGELFAALSGERPAGRAEAVRIGGVACGTRGIGARRRLGAAFVPEDRLGHAAVPAHALSENALLSRHATDDGLVRRGLVALSALRRLAGTIRQGFDVRPPGGDPRARALSGGNLQKFVVGREIARRPRLLVVDQPTWGLDAGAARLIRQAIVDLASAGSAVLVIGQDLDELIEIADRLAVIHDGRLSPARPAAAWTREAIGLAMMGVAEEAVRDAA